ncbi:hypothetical protein [Streptomyces sp. NBC_00083]|uniref:hypothetical protein n=1 Tax=Streptomyces sp. NBC_00083 TaxID=2975647 RepID=UPI0022510A66|nr:hypothetical protein [Streptomyces sp. NBC_00083]MCX5384902.1 hypothetical protein [Streptomyces sp. NBC_00083]
MNRLNGSGRAFGPGPSRKPVEPGGAARPASTRRASTRPTRTRGTLATIAVAVLAAATLIATGTPSGATGPGDDDGGATTAGSGPVAGAADAGVEADVSYHGHVSLWNGRVGLWLTTANHGPAPLAGATVRLRFSVPLDRDATLPPSCLRTGPAVVHCGTGAMRAAGSGAQLALDVATVGTPNEVGVDIDTVWNGGISDRNLANNTHRVVALATGDAYTF